MFEAHFYFLHWYLYSSVEQNDFGFFVKYHPRITPAEFHQNTPIDYGDAVKSLFPFLAPMANLFSRIILAFFVQYHIRITSVEIHQNLPSS